MKKSVTFTIDTAAETIGYQAKGCGPADAVTVGQELLDVVAAGLFEVARRNDVDPDVFKWHVYRSVELAFDVLAREYPSRRY